MCTLKRHALLAVALLTFVGSTPVGSVETPLVREVYVPYEELLKIAAKDPSGVVMALDEYRLLVERALGNRPKPANTTTEPPPFGATVSSATITGSFDAGVASFRAELEVDVAATGWVRCDLGPSLPHLGTIRVDGKPAWALRGAGAQSDAPKEERLSLVLRGVGRHLAVLEYSVRAREVEDRWVLDASVPQSAATQFSLQVLGAVVGESDPPFLARVVRAESSDDPARTVFTVGLGGRTSVRLSWKVERSAGQQSVIVAAQHRILVRLDPEAPKVEWHAAVDVFRRKTDVLELMPPPGVRVIEARSSLLHSLTLVDGPEGPIARVLLLEPTMGRVDIDFVGVLEFTAESPVELPATPEGNARYRFTLGRPRMPGAIRDHGIIGVQKSSGLRFSSVATQQLEDAEKSDLPRGALAGSEGWSLDRLFVFDTLDAQLTIDLESLPAVHDVSVTHRFRIGENGSTLVSAFRVEARHGRIYDLDLSVPTSLELLRIEEAGSEHGRHPVDTGPGGQDEPTTVRVALIKGLEPGRPLVLHAFFAWRGASVLDAAETSFSPPEIVRAAKQRATLGIELAESFEAALGDITGWRTVPRGRLVDFAFDERFLIAAIEADADEAASDTLPVVPIRVRRKAVRGIYEAVTHTLINDTVLRVRADVRLTVFGRPVDAVAVRLPVPPGAESSVRAQDVREWTDADANGRRVLRFQRPWRGERLLRFDYDLPLDASVPVPIPLVAVFPDAADDGTSSGVFDGLRFAVLASADGVEVTAAGGSALTEVDVDDLPEFSEPSSTARTVAVFKVNERVADGSPTPTLTASVFSRSPILKRGIPKLALETTIDRSGVSRTVASFVLRYQGDQHLAVDLHGATMLSVQVDDQPVRPIERDGTVLIPLEPRSYASIRFLYERVGSQLGTSGSWRERGPDVTVAAGEGGDAVSVPVVKTTWTMFLPAGLHVQLSGDAVDSLSTRGVATFAETFWGRLFAFRWPRWTAWESVSLGTPTVAAAAEGVAPARSQAASSAATTGGVAQLRAEQQPSQSYDPTVALPTVRVIHEGVRVDLTKLGGGPEVTLLYLDPKFERFSARAIFFVSAILGLVLLRLGRRELYVVYTVGGVAVATFLPAALAWESPLLARPFAEGLVATALVLVACWLGRRIASWLATRIAGRASRYGARGLVVVFALLCAGLTDRPALAQSLKPVLPSDAESLVDGPVVIPYSLDQLDVSNPLKKRQVYIPYRKFVELWNLANPDKTIAADADQNAPAELIVGEADYNVDADDRRYRIEGKLSVRLFTNEWTALPLHFDGAQLASIRLDGAPAGVSYSDGVPFLALHGVGEHEVRVVVEGTVTTGIGDATIDVELVPGTATRVAARLPAGIELDRSAGGSPVQVLSSSSSATGSRIRCRVDLGSDARLLLHWRSGNITSERRPIVVAKSASGLTLDRDGYHVDRLQRVHVEGSEVGHLRFRVIGDWDISGVQGRDLSEWVVRRDDGDDNRFLEVFFTKRRSDVELTIRGFAGLGTDPSTPADLSLEIGGDTVSVRQDGFFALKHHRLRRFHDTWDVRRDRVTQDDFVRAFFDGGSSEGHDGFDGFDRIFHSEGSAVDVRIRSVPTEVNGRLEAQFVGIVTAAEVSTVARVTFTSVDDPGVLEYVMPLPDGWEVVSSRGEVVKDWDVRTAADGQRTLVVRFRERVRAGAVLEWYARGPNLDAATLDTGFQLPRFIASGPFRQESTWVLAASDDLDLNEGAETTLTPLALELSPRWATLDPHTSYRMAYRSMQSDSVLAVSARVRRSVVRAASTAIVRVSDRHVDLKTRVRFSIERRGASQFQVRIPVDARHVTVGLANQLRRQDQATPDGLQLTLTLPSPVVGNVDLDVTYRLDRPDGASIPVRGLEVLGVDSVDEYLVIDANPLHDLRLEETAGLESVRTEDFSAHPDLARAATRSDIEQAFLVIGRPWRLVLVEEESERVRGFDALVEFAEIKTVVAADGSNWSSATYTIHNRSRQFLSIVMPNDADVWRVLVNGRPVRVSREDGGGALLVPIERMTATDLSIAVAITYAMPRVDLPAAWESFVPAAPRVGLENQSFETLWRLHLPQRYSLSFLDGNLRQAIESVEHGERVRNLIGQFERIQKRVDDPIGRSTLTRRERFRANKNLVELQQALQDAVQDLKTADSSGAGRDIDADELAQQVKESRQFVEEGAKNFAELKRLTTAQDKQKGVAPRVDRAFDGALRFLDADESKAVREPTEKNGGRTRGTLETFRGGLGPVKAPGNPVTAGERAGTQGDNRTALDGRMATDVERVQFSDDGVDVTLPEEGSVYLFRGKVGQPELEVRLVARDVGARTGHALGLVVTIAALGLWWRSRRLAK